MRTLHLASCLLLLVPASRAAACGAPACEPAGFDVGREALVPANAPGVGVDLGWDHSLEERTVTPRLVENTADGWVEREAWIEDGLLVPAEGFVAGARYRVELETTGCGYLEDAPFVDAVEIAVIDPAPLPLSLGALTAMDPATGAVPVPSAGGSCYEGVDAVWVDVATELDAQAAPWADVLEWETYVDGERYGPRGTLSPGNPYGVDPSYPGSARGSWRGVGVDRVYAACASGTSYATPEGVAPGVHQVTMVATIPGTALTLETEPVTIELTCPAVDPGCPSGDPTCVADDGPADPFCPSGVYGPQGACHPAGTPLPSSGGGCSATGASRGGLTGALALLVVGLAFVRRRG